MSVGRGCGCGWLCCPVVDGVVTEFFCCANPCRFCCFSFSSSSFFSDKTKDQADQIKKLEDHINQEPVPAPPLPNNDCLDGDCDLLDALPVDVNVTDPGPILCANCDQNNTHKNATDNSLPAECKAVRTIVSENNPVCNILSVTGIDCESDMTYEQGKQVCAEHGKVLCSHAQMEAAFQCGFKCKVCGWTKSTVKDGGKIVERLLEEELEICELPETDKNNQKVVGGTYGAHCCDAEVVSKRRFLRRR